MEGRGDDAEDEQATGDNGIDHDGAEDAVVFAEVMHLVQDLRENYGIFCSIVVYPVIPRGLLILRVIPTALHSLADVDRTLAAFEEVQVKLNQGAYTKSEAPMVMTTEDY